jgi:hypothetical protein
LNAWYLSTWYGYFYLIAEFLVVANTENISHNLLQPRYNCFHIEVLVSFFFRKWTTKGKFRYILGFYHQPVVIFDTVVKSFFLKMFQEERNGGKPRLMRRNELPSWIIKDDAEVGECRQLLYIVTVC